MKQVNSFFFIVLFTFSIVFSLSYLSSIQAGNSDIDWSIVAVSEEPGDEIGTAISGNKIVWQEGQSGFVYNVITGKRTSLDLRPTDISGNLIVGTKNPHGSGPDDIYLYNISDGSYTLLASNATWGTVNDGPFIEGNRVVWICWERVYDVYIYDLDSDKLTQITNTSLSEFDPDISGDYIVYRKYDDTPTGDWAVCVYNLTSGNETVVATQQYSFCDPVIDVGIYGVLVVWVDTRNGNKDIYMYNLTSEQTIPICTNSSDQENPSISGRIIAWNDARHNTDIYIYNITSDEEIRVTNDTHNVFLGAWRHSVSNNGKILCSRTGNGSDIYVAVPGKLIIIEAEDQIGLANLTDLFENNEVLMIYPSESSSKPLGVKAAMVSDWTSSAYIYTKLNNVTESLDTDPAFVNQSNGRPMGETESGIVTLGGPDVNLVTYHAENSDKAPLNFIIEADMFYFRLSNGTAIPGASLPRSVINNDQDMFLVEVFKDKDDRYVMICQGFGWKGTYAAGKYFYSVIYPDINSHNEPWIIVKWEDTNGDGFVNMPDEGDTYTIIARAKCDDETSVVSVAYDPNIKDYKNEEVVHDLVVLAIRQLNPGDTDNPLSNLIDVGDVVVLKPNLVSLKDLERAGCTRISVIQPIIELAANAGASKVIVTEGSANPNWEDEVFHESGVVAMVTELDSNYPNTIISYQNVNTDNWTWVDLSKYSALRGRYEAHELYGHNDIQMDQNSYYYAEDSNGYNPYGYTPGLYAISNTILEADVFINLPKLKVHAITGVTISLKNLIGITVTDTHNTTNQNPIKDTPHWNTSYSHRGEEKQRVDTFDNDVIWRVNADLHKIAIYVDKNGVLCNTPQRKYLSVVDGVIGMEGPYIYDGEPDPNPTGVIIAGRDPIAVDIVGSRIMGFNHSVLKSITNMAQISNHIFGTTKPSNICVIGTSLSDTTLNDSYIPHVNYEDERTEPYDILLSDTSAPIITQVSFDPDPLTTDTPNKIFVKPEDVESVAAGWLQYSFDGTDSVIAKMMKKGDNLYGTIGNLSSASTLTYAICLQDEFMNLEWSEEMITQIEKQEPARASIIISDINFS